MVQRRQSADQAGEVRGSFQKPRADGRAKGGSPENRRRNARKHPKNPAGNRPANCRNPQSKRRKTAKSPERRTMAALSTGTRKNPRIRTAAEPADAAPAQFAIKTGAPGGSLAYVVENGEKRLDFLKCRKESKRFSTFWAQASEPPGAPVTSFALKPNSKSFPKPAAIWFLRFFRIRSANRSGSFEKDD